MNFYCVVLWWKSYEYVVSLKRYFIHIICLEFFTSKFICVCFVMFYSLSVKDNNVCTQKTVGGQRVVLIVVGKVFE